MLNASIKLQQVWQRLKFIYSIPIAKQHFETYPPTFIIGAPRSGTTLTLKLFQNQPLITSLFEPQAFWSKAFRDSPDDTYQNQLNWLGFQALRYLYYREITSSHPYLVVKDPKDSIRIESLNHLFPQAKFIHIIRDGRDVVASMMKTFDNELYYLTPEEAWAHVRIPNYQTLLNNPSHINGAIQWQYCVETSLKALANIPKERQFTFSYEDLIQSPQEIATQLFNFACPQVTINQESLNTVISSISNQVSKNLSVNFSNDPQIPWSQRLQQFSSLVQDDAGSGTTSDNIRVGRWQQEINSSILSEIEPIIGSTLKKLGYQ
ncbi:MAG: sulfotransferase [Microcystaceae cyanobacterium]